jgi:hypothetical protein
MNVFFVFCSYGCCSCCWVGHCFVVAAVFDLDKFILFQFFFFFKHGFFSKKTGTGVALADASGNSLLSLALHPWQRSVPNELLEECCRRVLIDVTNQVGVDLNLMVTRPYANTFLFSKKKSIFYTFCFSLYILFHN